MEIYVVLPGDSIYSIAEKYGVSVEKLVKDNGLSYPYDLVIGQAIIIAYAKQSYVVQEGDSLEGIAAAYDVPVMQLLRNNPDLSAREFIYPGETLVISYRTQKSIMTNGYAYPYINRDSLCKILPNLTYLSVFNYRATEKGQVIEYQDDTDIIELSKAFGVVPLLMLTTLSRQGQPDIETAYSILGIEEYQERTINEFMEIMKQKGYRGINIVFNYLNKNSESLYHAYLEKISLRVQQEGYLFFITVNFPIEENGTIVPVDYEKLSRYVDGMVFMRFVWGSNIGPPTPVSNINYTKELLEYLLKSNVPPNKIVIGKPTIGYDWELPYVPGESSAYALSILSVYNLAREVNAIVLFDETSQTPYFYYEQNFGGISERHIIWFIDGRSINALNELIFEYNLNGSGIWNIMIYYPQLWTTIIATFDIIKLI